MLEHAPYEFAALNHCEQAYTIGEIRDYKPKVILAMGNVPLRQFTGYTGKKRTVMSVRGFYLDNIKFPGIPVIGTIHPSAVARDKPNLLGVIRTDMLRALELSKAGGKFQRPSTSGYILFPPIDVARRWLEELKRRIVNGENLLNAYDIETYESISGTDESELRAIGNGRVEWIKTKSEFEGVPEHILEDKEVLPEETVERSEVTITRINQIQFSTREGEAIVLPFEGDYVALAREVLALSNPKVGWNNWTFDDPLLAEAGIQVRGVNHDAQWAWHVLQPDLPRGLQFGTSFFIPEAEPWKHTSEADPGIYGGCDVAYPQKFFPQMLQRLKEQGLENGYERHTRQLWPILVGAAQRGIPVDNEKRLALGVEVDAARAAVDLEIQGLVPDSLRNCEPKEGYVNPNIAEKNKLVKPLEVGERWAERGFKAKDGEMVVRWCRLQPFLPGSPQQLMRWIKWKREEDIRIRVAGYKAQPRYSSLPHSNLVDMAERNSVWKIPTEFKTGRETTEKKGLERLGKATGDHFFRMVIEHREYGKIKSTYVIGWTPEADGVVRTTFSFAPATGQLSSRGPNVQNDPMPKSTIGASAHRSRIAQAFQNMIVAKSGKRIVEFDYKSYHVLLLGYLAKDPTYMRLARIDMHSYFAAHLLKISGRERWLELSDQELAIVLGKVKKEHKAVRDGKAKPTLLAVGFCAGPNRIYDMNQESFTNVAEVKVVRKVLEGLFPQVFQYQRQTAAQVHDGRIRTSIGGGRGYLQTPFGCRRYFWDVFHWDSKKGCDVHGADYEAAVAYPTANCAFGIKKDAMLRLEGAGLMEKFGFMNDKHDALKFHCDEKHVEECLWTVREEMQRPCLLLTDPVVAPEGLWCEVEAKVGRSQGEMKDVKWDRERKGVGA